MSSDYVFYGVCICVRSGARGNQKNLSIIETIGSCEQPDVGVNSSSLEEQQALF